jgi:hypothetical protein
MPPRVASFPVLLTVDDAADSAAHDIPRHLRDGRPPAAARRYGIGRRPLFRADDLLDWLDQKRAIAEGVTGNERSQSVRIEEAAGRPTSGRRIPDRSRKMRSKRSGVVTIGRRAVGWKVANACCSSSDS